MHASALFGNWAGPLFCFSFMAVCCSSTNMLKRNSSVGKVLYFVFLFCFVSVYEFMVWDRKWRVPVTSYCVVLFFVASHCKTISIVQYTKDPTVTIAIFMEFLRPKNFFGRIEHFSNVPFFSCSLSLSLQLLWFAHLHLWRICVNGFYFAFAPFVFGSIIWMLWSETTPDRFLFYSWIFHEKLHTILIDNKHNKKKQGEKGYQLKEIVAFEIV